MKKDADCGEKSHVGMVLCTICQEPMEILLDRRLKKSLCRNNIIPGRVCEECGGKYLSEGILIMNPDTGSLVVVKDEALHSIMNGSAESEALYQRAVKSRRAFATEKIVQMFIGATKGE